MTNIKDATVTELKAECFDREQQIKMLQSQLSQVYKVLEEKLKKEEVIKTKINDKGGK
jgi:hypothetical protein